MSILHDWKDEIASVLCFVVLVFSIKVLRKRHSQEIYVFWYCFSLSFTIFGALFLYGDGFYRGLSIENVIGETLASATMKAYQILINFDGEVTFVALILGIVAVPQYITYFLSGISGSATQPFFVSTITKAAIWSIIKFLAGCGGVYLAAPFSALLLSGELDAGGLANGMLNLSVGAAVMAIYLKASVLWDGKRESAPGFKSMHTYFTRNALDENERAEQAC